MKTGARGDIARGVRTPSTAVLSFGRIMRLSRLWDKKTKDFPAEHGLEPGEYGILSTLRRSGEPYELTAGTFLKASPVSSSAPPTATRSRGRHGRAGRRPTRGSLLQVQQFTKALAPGRRRGRPPQRRCVSGQPCPGARQCRMTRLH